MNNKSKAAPIQLVIDMDSTLLSMECLDSIVETALSAQLEPDTVAQAMEAVNREMDKGMSGESMLVQTIPARIEIAKHFGAPVKKEHFDIVTRIVPNTLTQSIVMALRSSILKMDSEKFSILILSGGPQECVDATVDALITHLDLPSTKNVTFKGIGNKIVVTEDGSFDQLNSSIFRSKVDIVRNLMGVPEHTIMIGDGVTDLQVYDAGIATYFIAVGLWVKRTVLFERPENLPYYSKVEDHAKFEDVLETSIKAAKNRLL